MSLPAISIVILGSGTAIPSLERRSAGYLVTTHELTALVDCGNGTLRQLLRTGHDYADLDAVFITHTHADHVADLVPLIQALNLLALPRVKPLDIFGPPGIGDFVELRVLPVSSTPSSFEVRTTEAVGELRRASCAVTTTPTVHAPTRPSLAYRFEVSGRVVVFSGDADVDPGLATLARGADILVVDCSYPDALKVEGHLCASECGRLAADAGVQTVVLSHIYATDLPDSVRVEECRAHFNGEILLARDGMELHL